MKVIFKVYTTSRVLKKRELRKNIYSAKISTFTVTFSILWDLVTIYYMAQTNGLQSASKAHNLGIIGHCIVFLSYQMWE